ncbi:MAG: type II toxin-antitoxin system VapC family toxin [Candidatus Aminicenantes bacterium]|nr:type II toxin-antitoxin system VapC family toxin [Candidatus Aminicenantes bacterium]
MILIDTSVWVDHLRKTDQELSKLLDKGVVLCHPFVIGELACGNLKNRSEILDLLAALPKVEVASHEEAMHLVTHRKLWGKGIGWIDIHLLASALLSNCTLWTKDKALHTISRSLNIGV